MSVQNSEYWKNYYVAHREQRKSQQRAYYQRHRESCLAYSRLYYSQHQEDKRKYDKVYYQKNKEKKSILNRLYAKTHRAEHNKHSANYRMKHKGYVYNYQHRYYENHKEEKKRYREENKISVRKTQRIVTNRYRSHRKYLESSLTLEQWEAIKTAYKNRCAYCGKQTKNLTQDHVIPVSLNGPYVAWNIVPACLSCNSRKRNKLPIKPPAIRLMV